MNSKTDNEKAKKSDNFTDNMEWVLIAVAKGRQRVATISKMTEKDKSNVHRTLKILGRKGYVYKEIETKSYYPTEKGYKRAIEIATPIPTTKTSRRSMSDNVSGTNGVKPLVRGENSGLKLKILRKPKDWGYRRREIFLEKDFQEIMVNDKLKNWDQVNFHLDDVLVKTSDSHLLFHFPKKDYATPVEAQLDLMRAVLNMKGRLERRIKGLVLGNKAQFVGMELADLKDLEGAGRLGEFEEHENYVVWKDPKTGKQRLLFDRSPGNWEFEYKMAEWSFDDATEILRRRADEVLNPNMPLASDLAVKQESTEHLLNEAARVTLQTAKSLDYYGKHWVAHVDVLKELKDWLRDNHGAN